MLLVQKLLKPAKPFLSQSKQYKQKENAIVIDRDKTSRWYTILIK